jgi:hypothetical protein
MGSLDQTPEREIEKSRVITISLPRSNPNMKSDIDAELDNGWHIQTSFYDTSRDELRIIFVKPKRNQ